MGHSQGLLSGGILRKRTRQLCQQGQEHLQCMLSVERRWCGMQVWTGTGSLKA